MPANPFDHLTGKVRWKARLNRWRDNLTRPMRPSRIAPDRKGPPNLLLIGIDTLRGDHLGSAGYTLPTTPHLDSLGAAGVVFQDVTAAAPWTLPSFSSSLTGRMPGLHGGYLSGDMRNMDNQPPARLNDDVTTLATHLKSAGYRTAAFYSNQFFAFGLAESFDEHTYINLPAAEVARQADDWMRCHADEPFFCFILFNDPHEPTTPDAEDLAPFLPSLAAQGVATDDQTVGRFSRWGEAPGPILTQAKYPADKDTQHACLLKVAVYDATIHYVDRVIGELQASLVRRDLTRTTLVSVYSDHGEEFLDHANLAHQWGHDPRGINGIGHGHAHFQEVLRVPWMAWGAGVPVGQKFNQPVSLLDLTPTLLDWLGLPAMPVWSKVPEEWQKLLGGISQARRGDESNGSRIILSEAMAFGPDLVALRRENYKLIAHRDGRVLALFDLHADPAEQKDISQDQSTLVAELTDFLTRWRESGFGATGALSGEWNDMDDTIRQRLKDLGYSD